MPSLDKRRNTGCPIAYALDTFGDRWSLVIIRDLLMRGFDTFGQFLQSDEGIATNVLANRLQEFEVAGIVSKSRDPQNHRRIIYRLTEKGADLAPVMLEMVRWSGKYDENTKANKTVLDRIENDRGGLIADLRSAALDPKPAASDSKK